MNEMKKILLIGTGGTIASDVTDSGLAPELTTEQLLSHIPGSSDSCGVDCLQLLNLDSTNKTPAHWLEIAACIREHYGCYDGFVITHGTDTMASTAAALSYLIQGSPKPIVLTGAQRPIGFDSTDSKTNLADAFRCAAEDLPGVSIVFNSRVILGTRAKKTRSKSFQAFSSINHPELGVLRDGVLLRYIRQDCREAPGFYDRLDPRVALLNIGAEESKGLELQKQTYALLTEAKRAGRIHFVGNIEGREAITQGVDVLVTDGYTGNIFLKTMEGAAALFSGALKEMLLASTKNKVAALMLKNSIGDFKKRFDSSEVGGTALLGISQPVVKAHGSSNAYAFYNAIRQAKTVAEADIVGDIAANVEHMRWERPKPAEKQEEG